MVRLTLDPMLVNGQRSEPRRVGARMEHSLRMPLQGIMPRSLATVYPTAPADLGTPLATLRKPVCKLLRVLAQIPLFKVLYTAPRPGHAQTQEPPGAHGALRRPEMRLHKREQEPFAMPQRNNGKFSAFRQHRSNLSSGERDGKNVLPPAYR